MFPPVTCPHFLAAAPRRKALQAQRETRTALLKTVALFPSWALAHPQGERLVWGVFFLLPRCMAQSVQLQLCLPQRLLGHGSPQQWQAGRWAIPLMQAQLCCARLQHFPPKHQAGRWVILLMQGSSGP